MLTDHLSNIFELTQIILLQKNNFCFINKKKHFLESVILTLNPGGDCNVPPQTFPTTCDL